MTHLTKILLFCVFVSLLFYYIPQIDLFASSLFYDAVVFGFKNKEYYLEHRDYLMLSLDCGFIYGMSFLCIAFVLCYAAKIYMNSHSLHYKHYTPVLYLIAVAVVGLLIVTNVAKDYVFNRARPEAIMEFGGEKIFTPAFAISDQCSKNCSFVSGHAAGAFLLFASSFLITNKKRRILATIFTIIFGVIIGFGRISFGKHFLSDVLFAGFFMYIISYILALAFALPSVKYNEKREY